MSQDFLTVEDVNTIINKYGVVSLFHCIDTSLIGSADYSNVLYDFVKVSKTTNASNITYTFEVRNNAWNGEFYFTKANDAFMTDVGSYNRNNHTITLTTSEDDIKLYLYCTWLNENFLFKRVYLKPLCVATRTNPLTCVDTSYMKLDELNKDYWVCYHNLANNQQINDRMSISEVGVYNMSYVVDTNFYYLSRLEKTNLQFNCIDTLTLGKINTVKLGVANEYKPNGSLIGNNTPTITIQYKNETITAYWSNTLNDYCFDLDLTNITKPKKIKFKVIVERNDVINHTETDVKLNSTYEIVDNWDDLVSACDTGGAEKIMLSMECEINFEDDLTVKHDLTILTETDDEYYFNVTDCSIILNENTRVKFNNIIFQDGDRAIIQNKNSKLELNNCKFKECISTNNNLGACIYTNDECITILNNVLFYNNFSSIFHQGELQVNNCKLLQTNGFIVDINNPNFLYQSKGNAIIKDSVFDIDFGSRDSPGDFTEWCDNQVNLGVGQALILLGESATVNEKSYYDLKNNDSSNLFSLEYRNQSHIFAKYYYPSVESCVFVSPKPNFEDKCVCWCLAGVDYVFKENVQITRREWGSENRIRKIHWEDI